MIEIYECTDCTHCADFSYGDRVYCLHPDLPTNEVCLYSPVADNKNAENCVGFNEGDAHEFDWRDINKYEAYCTEKDGNVVYDRVREWIEQQIKDGHK